MTTGQAAKKYKKSKSTIRRWIKKGKLNAKKVKGRWVILGLATEPSTSVREGRVVPEHIDVGKTLSLQEFAKISGFPEVANWREVYNQITRLADSSGTRLWLVNLDPYPGYGFRGSNDYPTNQELTLKEFTKWIGLGRTKPSTEIYAWNEPTIVHFADWDDMQNQIRQMQAPLIPNCDPPPSFPSIKGVSPKIDEVARYLVEGFYDWDNKKEIPPGDQWMEIGVRQLFDQEGNPNPDDYGYGWFHPSVLKKVITVKYNDLRPDWHDDFKRAMESWEELGFFKFKVVNHYNPNYGTMNQLPDIIADDERSGAYLFKNGSSAIDGWKQRYVWYHNAKTPVFHTTLRKLNVSKRWRENSLHRAFCHELGHAIGLGHAGPYPVMVWNAALGSLVPEPYKKIFDYDNTDYTVMSYIEGTQPETGPKIVDRVALEMLYG